MNRKIATQINCKTKTENLLKQIHLKYERKVEWNFVVNICIRALDIVWQLLYLVVLTFNEIHHRNWRHWTFDSVSQKTEDSLFSCSLNGNTEEFFFFISFIFALYEKGKNKFCIDSFIYFMILIFALKIYS